MRNMMYLMNREIAKELAGSDGHPLSSHKYVYLGQTGDTTGEYTYHYQCSECKIFTFLEYCNTDLSRYLHIHYGSESELIAEINDRSASSLGDCMHCSAELKIALANWAPDDATEETYKRIHAIGQLKP